jgi:hypothetical protein
MVAQINEQQAAVVALAVNPAGQAGLRTGVGSAQGATGMRTINVHVKADGVRKFVAP